MENNLHMLVLNGLIFHQYILLICRSSHAYFANRTDIHVLKRKRHRFSLDSMSELVDVVILGAGLAGLSLARQLILNSDEKILLLEKRTHVPPARQKVGEATVQLSGYYFSRVLDLEEHLLRKHFMKYNLRFYWKTRGRNNDSYEDYSQSYIREMSNVPTYQLDRNKLEAELLRLNERSSNFTYRPGVSNLLVELSEVKQHRIAYQAGGMTNRVEARWVVDTSGRSRFLARQFGLLKENPIRHGASFLWVEGLLNVEKLTGLSPRESRLHRQRSFLGHLPVWLATNHFVGEGFWFWTIPLHGKTSLGLVYDRDKISANQVNTPSRLIDWVCQEFPLFGRDLRKRKIIDHSQFQDFSYDCRQTISDSRWALAGEAGRFTDPLYSPGGDLISLYNTLITDCILTRDSELLKSKTRMYESMMRSFYQAYVPSYSVSYEALGDQECFAMKYAWELSVYFTFYVFPFINDLFTDEEFAKPFLQHFACLGRLNANLQRFITSYYRWKKQHCASPNEPTFFDFTEVGPLARSEDLFYKVGVSALEALRILDQEMINLEELARYIVAHVDAQVAGEPSLVQDRHFVENISLSDLEFDPEQVGHQSGLQLRTATHHWGFDPYCLVRLGGTRKSIPHMPSNADPAECLLLE
jgi:flavin-dependent dehydrogenase